jgi:hypothetical protein
MDNQKTLVPILVFEDTPLHTSEKLRKKLDFPKSKSAAGEEFVFDWHPVYNAMGGFEEDAFDDPVLMRSIEEYRNAILFLREELKGPAILFVDMTFSETGSTLFSIEDSDITDQIVKFVECYTEKETNVSRAKSYLNPEMMGFTLAVTAAANPNWYGVITFASKRVDVDLKKIRKCLGNNTQILWRNLRASLAADALLTARAEFVEQAVGAFVERRKGPPFWPSFTKGWFQDENTMPPHEAPQAEFNYEAATKIKEYLEQLLPGFILPSRWFREPEWKNLYEALKGMIGYHSAAAGNERVETNNLKNLRLGALPLLLAAQMSWKKENIDWFQSYVWDRGRLEIMAHNETAKAQDAIRAMAVFLEHLSIGKDGSNQVCGATWSLVTEENPTPHLWLDFQMDPLNQTAGRGLLPMIFRAPWGGSKGQTILAYEQMMKLAQPQPNSPPFFSLCIYPHVDEEKRVITRLDFCQVE